MTTIDARGQDCPKPVMMTRDEVLKGCAELAVLVDNKVALENVTRFLENSGYSVERAEDGAFFRITAAKTQASPRNEPGSPKPVRTDGDYAFLITSDTIGAESDGLGELLMKSWLGTIKQRSPLPKAVALMNGGVRLALPGSAAEVLGEMEEAGVELLVCGTCTKHFGITDDIAVGKISNMFEITEAVYSTSKPITVS